VCIVSADGTPPAPKSVASRWDAVEIAGRPRCRSTTMRRGIAGSRAASPPGDFSSHRDRRAFFRSLLGAGGGQRVGGRGLAVRAERRRGFKPG
jgi:hypothetical protein